MEERVQKILARTGFGSRRACEELISTGRVTINGKPAVLGSKADAAKDTIHVDGVKLNYTEPEYVYIALYKPRNVLSDREPGDPRQTVFSLVPESDGLFVVGRLDFESEGLMLLTNDGNLANKLSHPRYGKEKEYHVLVAKRPDEEQLNIWRRGVVLEDGEKTQPANVTLMSISGKGAWLRVVMREGRKRQIREIGKQIGLPIVKLVRVRIGTLEIGNLKPREWAHLTEKELKDLRDLASKAEKQVSDPEKKKPRVTDRRKVERPARSKPATGEKRNTGRRPSAAPKGRPKK